jgi:hypothetical protein
MPDSTQDIILEELRALRGDFNSFAREHGERVSVLETGLSGLLGNGQPGRVTTIERGLEALTRWRWWVVGAAAGSSAVISVLAWVVEAHK